MLLTYLYQLQGAAAKEVRIAFFLEWATPNQEDKVKKAFDRAFGVPVKWTNFATGGEMTEAMLSGDIDISYSQGLTPFVNAVNAQSSYHTCRYRSFLWYGRNNLCCI
ncbi:MAG: hypothetical protein Ct9H300mP28_31950 [Pseudomonadota bacterium]|nr:MAG: hypothetical protein Ct9H300mP28_31950 [Pseudomonadota bacterium]